MKSKANQKLEPPLLTKRDVARLSGLSVRTIERLTAKGVLKAYRPGGLRMVRYRRAEVLQWIKDGYPKRRK